MSRPSHQVVRGRVSRVWKLSWVLLVLAPAAALAAGGAGQVWTNSTCLRERYKPKAIILACGDGATSLVGLGWSSWSRRAATGKGTLKVNTCRPSCAAGKAVSYSVRVTLSTPKSCKKQKHKIFSRGVLEFAGKRPRHQPTRFTIGCPI